VNIALRPPAMTREQFLDWVQRQEGPFEFDGTRPVPMSPGTRRHSRILTNIVVALRSRLRAPNLEILVEAGLATAGEAVRYPDVTVAARGAGDDLLIPDTRVAFEVISPSSERTDRLVKLREYRTVASLRRYLIVEQYRAAVTVLERREGENEWRACVRLRGEMLEMPEIGIEIPVEDLYEGVDLPDEPTESAEAE